MNIDQIAIWALSFYCLIAVGVFCTAWGQEDFNVDETRRLVVGCMLWLPLFLIFMCDLHKEKQNGRVLD